MDRGQKVKAESNALVTMSPGVALTSSLGTWGVCMDVLGCHGIVIYAGNTPVVCLGDRRGRSRGG